MLILNPITAVWLIWENIYLICKMRAQNSYMTAAELWKFWISIFGSRILSESSGRATFWCEQFSFGVCRRVTKKFSGKLRYQRLTYTWLINNNFMIHTITIDIHGHLIIRSFCLLKCHQKKLYLICSFTESSLLELMLYFLN